MEIDSKLCNVAAVRVALTSLMSNEQLGIDEIMDIKTAVSEAVTNSIEHGYLLDENKKVIVTASVNKVDNMDYISIKIEDFGIGIEDIEKATTPAYTTKPELEHAGMGFTIMETFMDEVVINSEIGNGTVIILTKRIKTKRSRN